MVEAFAILNHPGRMAKATKVNMISRLERMNKEDSGILGFVCSSWR